MLIHIKLSQMFLEISGHFLLGLSDLVKEYQKSHTFGNIFMSGLLFLPKKEKAPQWDWFVHSTLWKAGSFWKGDLIASCELVANTLWVRQGAKCILLGLLLWVCCCELGHSNMLLWRNSKCLPESAQRGTWNIIRDGKIARYRKRVSHSLTAHGLRKTNALLFKKEAGIVYPNR